MTLNEPKKSDADLLRLLKEKIEAKEALELLKAKSRDQTTPEIMAATEKWYEKIRALQEAEERYRSN